MNIIPYYSRFTLPQKKQKKLKEIKTPIKILRIFRIVGHPRDPKGEDHGYLTTFRGINAPKSLPSKYENNAQTLLNNFKKNFEKGQKMTF